MKENLVVSLQHAERRAVSASDRLQRHNETLDALWAKIERKQGSRHGADRGWLKRYEKEFARVDKLARRAATDFQRESERYELFTQQLRERQRRAAVERKKAGKKPLGTPLAKPRKIEPKKKRAKKIPPKRWEYVLKVDYRANRKAHKDHPKHHHVWWDVRLKKQNGEKASVQELRIALRHLKNHGEPPPGWEMVGIRWDRGERWSWDDDPAREAEGPAMRREALNQLSNTIGRTEGADYLWREEDTVEVGEEEIEDDG